MSNILCNGCGQRVEVPEGHTRTKLRCPECGVFNELPKEVVEQSKSSRKPAAEDDAYAKLLEPDPPPPKPALMPPVAKSAPPAADDGGVYGFSEELKPKAEQKSEPKAVTKPESKPEHQDEEHDVLIHGTEDDDGNPYLVKGDKASKICPSCNSRIARKAKSCVKCGYHFETGKKVERAFEAVEREWEAGWPFKKRIAAFVALQVINFVTLVLALVNGYSLGTSFAGILITVGMQAFLVGTFERLNLKRTEKGKVSLLHTWRYAFIERPTEPLKWKECEGVMLTRYAETDVFAWVFAIILLGYGCLPGILFWYFVVRPDKFTVALTKDHGSPEVPIFRTANEQLAREILDTVVEITTLPVHT